ncbi:hypothetical protein R1flu_010426 [Riccia fluitans]|uniref:RING-type domain-containing protein n=1 Tax=Riccia fluitans TaxID=41844 RepID=A0ABD1Z4Z0_9MARC
MNQNYGGLIQEAKPPFDIDVVKEAEIMERHFSKEAETVKELSTLRKEEHKVRGKQEQLLKAYEDLSGQFNETMKVLQRLQDQMNDLQSRLGDIQQQSTSLGHKTKDAETRLETIRLGGNVWRKFFLSDVTKAKDKYRKDMESQEAKRVKLETDFKVSEQNLKTELQSERAKLLCNICLDKPRDTMILPCTHFLYCHGCLLIHKKRNNTCPTCRGSMSALLHCHLSIS